MLRRTRNKRADSREIGTKGRQAAHRRSAPSAAPALLAVAALVFSGCASEHYRVLRSEWDHPHLASLLEASSRIPSKTLMVKVDEVRGEPVRMAVRERGTGEGGRLVVLVHGLLTDSRTWRYLEGELGQDYDLLAMDMIGCGLSDKPAPEEMGRDGHSPSAHARRILRALRNRLAERRGDLKVTLVAQSYGGMVALRMLGAPDLKEEFADVHAKIDQAVLIAPAEFAIEKAYPLFKEISDLTDVEAFLGDLLGLITDRSAEFARYGTYEQEGSATRESADQFAEVLSHGDTRHSAQAIILNSVPFIEGTRPDWEKIERLTDDYARIDRPVMLIWGTRDTTLPLSMGYKLQREIPGAKLTVLEKTMHTIQGERPRLTANLIREFIARSGEGLPAVRRIDPYALDPSTLN